MPGAERLRQPAGPARPVDVAAAEQGRDGRDAKWRASRIEGTVPPGAAPPWREENRPDRACALWEKSAKFTSTSPGLQYDLGICRELAGELEAALEEYQKAEILLKGPNETVSTALDRVKKEIAARNKVSGDASR